MLYKSIIELVDKEIELTKQEHEREGLTERDKHYFTQGLNVAKQIIEQLEEIDTDNSQYAYERFEEIVSIYNNILMPDEIEDIVNRFMDDEIR